MSSTCLNCGKPLGSGTALCYTCESDGVTLDDVVDVDDDVRERVERYFLVAATKCHNCEELHDSVTLDGETYTASDFDLSTLDEWDEEMETEEAWMQENRDAIEDALTVLEGEWPEATDAVRADVL
ncbi:hypothetical protein [Halospeciosus flavus]|uniref:Uncharacterized protein n=1 Tax=Halospeciosus flavus TaxID=3032283 RepID=A0ABD5Z0Z5_9EURY|nr:hypothetical protein [Halospeciosus flavus]